MYDMKTEVYSWRVSLDLKTSLEREARRRKISMSEALETAAREWVRKGAMANEVEEEQRRLREAALQCVGQLSGGNTRRSETASEQVRARLWRRHDR